MSEPTSRRKDAHLDLAASGPVEPEHSSTLLEHVHLVHDALPDLALSDVDLSTTFLGKRLRAPLLVTGMTGGSERAAAVNRDLAWAAEKAGVAFGLGSQRAMSESPEWTASYRVREQAPTTVILGNIGLAQARKLGPQGCSELIERIGADGLCLHLNPAQELAQPEGDRDFRGGLDAVRALANELGERLIVKETGCGLSPAVAKRLVDAGVKAVDVSGAGGTSWVRVEALRAHGHSARLGEEFATWGIPTAAAVAASAKALNGKATIIAAGGIRTGLDAAKALALGANLAGLALPIFRAQQQGGREGAAEEILHVVDGLARALLLTGSRTPAELRAKPRVLAGALNDWLGALAGVP
ncbi:MAG: type 2 isopentenyl-diphosphate Delta-isomerase [Deltaproteobacteria bacterium]|nr:type 2 isopentenyl-diphosphate Delta-isomerase [Deltaproteobacteria bacterium]